MSVFFLEPFSKSRTKNMTGWVGEIRRGKSGNVTRIVRMDVVIIVKARVNILGMVDHIVVE